MKETLREYCEDNEREELLNEWETERNGAVTPDTVTYGSKRKVWWRCREGHEWEAMVRSRSQGSGCPVCAGRRILIGVNDLMSVNPGLASQWNTERNGNLKPTMFTSGAHKKVWWRCAKGHEWRASILSRSSGAGCPVCTGKVVVAGENDLKSAIPSIASEWHPTLNKPLTPEQVAPASNRKVWWLCASGHTYQATVSARTVHNSGCPYCAGTKVMAGFNDLATLEPKLATQWHPTLNGTLTPQQVTTGSCKKVWWQCSEGHVWKAVIFSRTAPQHCGCPVCAGRIRRSRTERYEASMSSAAP